MSEIRPENSDEIDLFELVETFWNGKWKIVGSTLIAALLGCSFLFFEPKQYESKLLYTADTVPPFYNVQKVSSDFEKLFYSRNMFESWKSDKKNTRIIFKDFSATETVDGFVVSTDIDDRVAGLSSENHTGSFITVKTDELKLLDDFFNYANHLNETLKTKYVLRAQAELNLIEARFNDAAEINDNIVKSLLEIDRFVDEIKMGADVVSIQRPTLPQKTSPKSRLILALSIVLGGMIGTVYVLIAKAVRQRKEPLAKA